MASTNLFIGGRDVSSICCKFQVSTFASKRNVLALRMFCNPRNLDTTDGNSPVFHCRSPEILLFWLQMMFKLAMIWPIAATDRQAESELARDCIIFGVLVLWFVACEISCVQMSAWWICDVLMQTYNFLLPHWCGCSAMCACRHIIYACSADVCMQCTQ